MHAYQDAVLERYVRRTPARHIVTRSHDAHRSFRTTQKILRHRFTFVSNKIIGWNRPGNLYARTRRMHIAIEYLPMDYSNFNSFFLFDRRWEVRRCALKLRQFTLFLSVFHFGAFSTTIVVTWPSYASDVGISIISGKPFFHRFFFIISEAPNASEYSTKTDEWKISWMSLFISKIWSDA